MCLGGERLRPRQKKEGKERRGNRKWNLKMKSLFPGLIYITFRTPPCRPRFPGQATSTLTGLATVYVTGMISARIESRRASVTCTH